jgi:hypothetical protein
MSRLGEWLAGPHKKIEVSSEGGRRYRVVARRKGFTQSEPTASIFMPASLYLPWLIFRYLRWDLVHRRHWIVEVYFCERPGSQRLEYSTEVDSGRRPLELAEAKAELLRRDDVPVRATCRCRSTPLGRSARPI